MKAVDNKNKRKATRKPFGTATDKSANQDFVTYAEEEDYYRQIVQIANVAIVKFNKDLLLTEYTGNAESIFGYKKEEVIGKKLDKTIVPRTESTGRNLVTLIKKLAQSPRTFEFNINENITKDGRRIWMQWHNSEIRDNRNRLTGTLSVGIDISNLINTEIALKESEERFKTLSDLTFEGIIIHDNGIILDCNLSFERQIGYERTELIGKNLLHLLVPPRYHKIMRQNFLKATTQYEIEAIHKNGTHIPVSIEARKAKIGNKIVRVAAVRNIGDLKKTIKELDNYKNHLEELVLKRTEKIKHQSGELKKQNDILQFERNQLRTIIDNIPDLIYIKDKESRFMNANKRQIRHLGKRRLKDIIGKTDFDFYEKPYALEYHKDEKQILKTGKPVIAREEPTVDDKGKVMVLLTTKVPLYDKHGKINSIVGIGRDITEIKNTENKLRERSEKIEKLNKKLQESNNKLEVANKILHERKEEIESTLEQLKNAQSQLVQSEKMASLGILTAGIAHEINNPVNFVYAGVNSLMKDFDDIRPVIEGIKSLSSKTENAEKVLRNIEELKKKHEFDLAYAAIAETLEDIKIGASRIGEIVAGLSRFSRMENEKWKSADLHEEIDSVLILLKNKYKHHIEIVKDYYEQLPRVMCHPGKLNQASVSYTHLTLPTKRIV